MSTANSRCSAFILVSGLFHGTKATCIKTLNHESADIVTMRLIPVFITADRDSVGTAYNNCIWHTQQNEKNLPP